MGLRDTLRDAAREASGADAKEAEADHVAALPRWEYHVERLGPGFGIESQFAKLGAKGWEFVAMIGDRAVFKRPAA